MRLDVWSGVVAGILAATVCAWISLTNPTITADNRLPQPTAHPLFAWLQQTSNDSKIGAVHLEVIQERCGLKSVPPFFFKNQQ